jgi:hypothetical protein
MRHPLKNLGVRWTLLPVWFPASVTDLSLSVSGPVRDQLCGVIVVCEPVSIVILKLGGGPLLLLEQSF